MAVDGFAPKIFSRTLRNGAPIYSVTAVLLLSCLSYLAASDSGAVAFGWFTGLVAVGLLSNKVNMIPSWFAAWKLISKPADVPDCNLGVFPTSLEGSRHCPRHSALFVT